MPQSAKNSLATIEDFLRAVGSLRKRAADPLSEPGNLEGEESDHPSAKVDDGLHEPPPEGELAKDNSRRIREMLGDNSTESAKSSAARRKRAEDDEDEDDSDDEYGYPGEMTVAPTMEDPDYDSNKVKDTKDDPGSEHPARTDNPEVGDKKKYAWDKMSMEKLAAEFARLGESLCADVAALSGLPLTKDALDALSQLDEQALAAQAGWEVAQSLAQEKAAQELSELEKLAALESPWGLDQEENLDKQAADALIRDHILEVIKSAEDAAVATASFLDGYLDTFLKAAQEEAAAAGEAIPPEVLEQMQEAPPPTGVDPAEAGAAGVEAGPDEAELLEALSAADSGAGEEDEAEAEEEALQLAQALEQLGVTPEELEAAMAEPSGHEVQAADRRAARRPKKATANHHANHMSQYIAELIRRSRG